MQKTNTYDKVQSSARQLRQKYGLSGPMTEADFYRICDGEGIELFRETADLLTIARGAIRGFAITVKGIPVIALACFAETEFDAFTAGHELGHTVLGHTGGTVQKALFNYENYRSDPREVEANLFAAFMLEEVPNA